MEQVVKFAEMVLMAASRTQGELVPPKSKGRPKKNAPFKGVVSKNLDLDALALWRAGTAENKDAFEKILKEKPGSGVVMYTLIPCFFSLHDSIEYIENQYRGCAEEREKTLIPKLSHLLNAGVAIPPDLMRRALAALKVKGFANDPGGETGREKNKGASIPPEELRRRQTVAGLLRALADLQGRGTVRRFNLFMRRIIFNTTRDRRNQIRSLLKSTGTQEAYATCKKIMEKIYAQTEIKKVKFPGDEKDLAAFIAELLRRYEVLTPAEQDGEGQ